MKISMSSETKAWLDWKRIFVAFIYVHYFLYSNQSLTFVKQRERHRQSEREGKKEGHNNTRALTHSQRKMRVSLVDGKISGHDSCNSHILWSVLLLLPASRDPWDDDGSLACLVFHTSVLTDFTDISRDGDLSISLLIVIHRHQSWSYVTV